MGQTITTLLQLFPPNRATQPVEASGDAVNVTIEAQAQYPKVLSAVFAPNDNDWYLFEDDNWEDTATQRNTVVVYWESDPNGTGGLRRLFYGTVWGIKRDQASRTVAITAAFDKLDVLNNTYAIYNDGTTNHYEFARTSPLLAITRVRLYPGHDYGNGFRHNWFPIFSNTDTWISTAGSNSTTLGENMASGASPANGSRLKLAEEYNGLPPAGFVSIDTEWIEYNGYAYDLSDGFWYIHDIQRGALGSTAAAHSAGATVYSRVLKRIFFRGPMRMEGYTGTVYELLKRSLYSVNYEQGYFAFGQDPLKYRTGSDYTQLYGSYPVYDEQGGGVLTLADWITEVCEADPEAGGPGFGGAYTDTATVVTSFTPDIVLTRIQFDRATFALTAIRDVLQQTQLAKGDNQDAVIWFYEDDSDEIRFQTVAQAAAGSPDRRYEGELRIDEEKTLEDPKSAILVRYESGTDFNLIAGVRCWHTQGFSDISSSFPQVRQLAGGVWGRAVALYPHSCNATFEAISGGPAGTTQLILDNDSSTGMGLFWDAEPSPAVQFYFWFPGVDEVTPDLYWIDKVVIALDVSGYTVDPKYFSITVFYYDTFTGSDDSTPPTPGTALPISEQMTLEYTPGALNNPTVTITAGPDLFLQGRAIGIKVDGYMQDVNNDDLWCIKLKDVAVFGKRVTHELVKIVSSYTDGSFDELVAPASTAKLRNALMGQHRTGTLDVGPATREIALNLAWLQLLGGLAMSEVREYTVSTVQGLRAGVPIIGETVQFEDGFAGVVDYWRYTNNSGFRELGIRVINFNTEIIGE